MDDYDVDDILGNNQGPKKRNSSRKGKRGELGLTKVLAARFNKPFTRVPQSGAYMNQRKAVSEHVKDAYVGDIVTPPGFRFTIEVKHGYTEIDLHNVIGHGGNKTIDGFLQQASRDAAHVGRFPLLCWKKDRMPWLAFLFPAAFKEGDMVAPRCPVSINYGGWEGVALNDLLKLPDTFWFKGD